MNDPTSWSSDLNVLKVGDTFTEEWLDRFRALMTAHSESKADAERYRWLRREVAAGRETYLAEGIVSESALDFHIDGMMGGRVAPSR